MKTAIVTGGTRGIGKAIALELKNNGYDVIVLYKSSVDEAALLEKNFRIRSYQCDVSNAIQVSDTFKQILADNIAVDLLVNNAGISYEGLLTDMSVDEWNNVISSNLSSMFYTSREIIPHFVSRKCGRIINISSMWGEVGASCEVAYSATKAGVNGFTKALAKELAPSGITVNAIAPGVIATDMMKGFTEDDINALKEQTPLGRIGEGSDVAKAVLYLSEDSGSFITGQIINVNGGFVI